MVLVVERSPAGRASRPAPPDHRAHTPFFTASTFVAVIDVDADDGGTHCPAGCSAPVPG